MFSILVHRSDSPEEKRIEARPRRKVGVRIGASYDTLLQRMNGIIRVERQMLSGETVKECEYDVVSSIKDQDRS